MTFRLAGERGAALIVAVMTTALMTALGTALVLTSMTETTISANYRDGIEAFYAAEAGAGVAVAELAAVDDWSTRLGVYADGPLDRLLSTATRSQMRVRVEIVAMETPGTVGVLSEAVGLGGSRRAVRLTIKRTDEVPGSHVRVLSWEEVQ